MAPQMLTIFILILFFYLFLTLILLFRVSVNSNHLSDLGKEYINLKDLILNLKKDNLDLKLQVDKVSELFHSQQTVIVYPSSFESLADPTDLTSLLTLLAVIVILFSALSVGILGLAYSYYFVKFCFLSTLHQVTKDGSRLMDSLTDSF